MANHTQRETRSGYPTFGLENGKRPGLGFDSSENPVLIDNAGNTSFTATPTTTTIYSGGTARTVYSPTLGAPRWSKITLTAAATGDQGSIVNPWGQAGIIIRCLLVVGTASSGAGTVSIGTAATNTSAANLIDTKSVAATGTFDNLVSADAGVNGKTFATLGATDFITIYRASGSPVGMVATVYVEFIPS